MDNQERAGQNDPMTPKAPGETAPAPAARNWFMRYGLLLTIFAAALVVLVQRFDLDLLAIAKVAAGLSLVIFIHELGHFLVAKWCDVHVETFSIGFGPALPGCQFQWGETTYKLAVFPLGGYVKMVGEGEEAEEEEEAADNPRSYKNKTVWQRMAIISAGVVMNVVLGFVLFIAVFMTHGDKRTPGIVGRVEAGSPAWQLGIPSGFQFDRIGSIVKPTFDQLMPEVGLSGDDELAVEGTKPDGTRLEGQIRPRLAKGDKRPVIGVATPLELRLYPQRVAEKRTIPVSFASAAAQAREIDLQPGDQIVATTDPEDPEGMKDMPPPSAGKDYDFQEFNRRLEKFAGKPMTIRVRRPGRPANASPEEIQLTDAGFQFDDQIVGTTDPAGTPFNPHRVKPLALDPGDLEQGHCDYFDFDSRMKLLAGEPIIVQVRRHGAARDDRPVSIWVPPAYHYTFKGLRMRMGKVAALRQRSTGTAAKIIHGEQSYGPGVKPGDCIDQVEIQEADGTVIRFVAARSKPVSGVTEKDLDPVRLPYELTRWADRIRRAGVQAPTVQLTVRRVNPKTHNENDSVTLGAAWDDAWRFDDAVPYAASSPTALAGLGIAYYIDSTIDGVTPKTPAAAAELQKGDRIKAIKIFKPLKNPGEPEEPVKDWLKLQSEEPGSLDEYNRWAYVDRLLQDDRIDVRKLVLQVDHDGVEREVTLTAEPDSDWPEADRGWILMGQKRLRKAENLAQAIQWGAKRTTDSIYYIYLGLLRMLTGRLSFADNTIGPLGIAGAAYTLAGEDFSDFLIFLAIISVNLAVVNFLPIPILDGGHMVFLVYEKLRGKPASEQVRIAATYVGLALIVSLMLVVVFLDVKRLWL